MHISPSEDAAIADDCVQKAPDVRSRTQDPYEPDDEDNGNDDKDCSSACGKAVEVVPSMGSRSELEISQER